MPRRSAQLLLVALALGAPPVGAVELGTRVNTIFKYEDTSGRESGDRDPQDISVKVGPDIRLHSTQAGKLDYDFSYRPEFEYFFTNREFNDEQVDHFVSARFSYRLSGRTTFFGSDTFSLVNNPRRAVGETPADDLGEPDLSLNNEQNIFNTLNLGLRHVFTPRISGTLSLASSLRTSENKGQSNSDSISGGANMNYGFSSRSSVGFGLNASRQNFDASDVRAAGGSTSVRLFGSYSHLFSPTLSFSASAGPLWIDPDTAETSGAVLQGPRFLFGRFDISGPVLPTTSLRTLRQVRFESDLDAFRNEALRTIEPREEDRVFVASGCTPLPGGGSTLPCSVFQSKRVVADPDTVAMDPTISRADLVDLAEIQGAQALIPLQIEMEQRLQNAGTLSLFANLSLTKTWERSQLGFTLRRDEANSIGDGISAVTTQGVVNWSWTPSERWNVRASFSYSLREATSDTFRSVRSIQASPQAGDLAGLAEAAGAGLTAVRDEAGSDLETMVFQARAERRLTRRLRGFVTFLYRDQSTQSEGRVLNQVEDIRVAIGLVFQFQTLYF